MRIPWKKLILLLAAVLTVEVARADEKATFPLLDGIKEAVIVVDKISSPPPLAQYIEKSTGKKPKVVSEKDYDPQTMPYAIFVGDTKKAHELFDKELDKMGIDDYIVHVASNLVVLTGATPETQAWAQYDFLRNYLGIDCYFPHELGLIIPKHDKVLIPVGTRLEKPAYQNRAWWGFNPQVKKGNFSQGVIPWRLPSINQRGPTGQHTIQTLITVEEYGKTHPEYFPMVDGKRELIDSGHKQGPCISNPEVVKIIIDKIRKYFDEHPKENFFALGMTDGGYCECPECKAMDGPAIEIPGCETDSSYSQRWYTFLNQVAAAIAKSHPGRIITTLGYALCDLPPKNIPVEGNIMPFLCSTRSTWFDPEVKKVNLAIADAWLERVDQIGIYEYYYGFSLAIPMIYTHDMADYLRHVRNGSRSKQVGFFAEANASWGLDGPKCWILEKLLWNPDQNVDKLTKEWCDAVFEEASPAMIRYFNELEKMRVKNGPKFNGLTEYNVWAGKAEKLNLQCKFGLWQKACQMLLFPPEDVAHCQDILEEARKSAKQDIVKKRIDYFTDTFKLTEYASKTYDAYSPLSKLLFTDASPQKLMEKLIEGDAKAPTVDALEFAQQLMAEDHTKFKGPSIHLAGCGLAVRKIINDTAGKAINKALKDGVRNREKLVDIGLDALKANAPGQEWLVTPAGKKRLDMLVRIAERVATAKRVKKAPVIDGKTDDAVWEWVDQSPWFNWQSTMPNDTKTKFAFTHDGKYLYLAIKCPQDDLTKQKRCPKKYGARTWQYPSVEFFLSTDQPGVDKKDLTFYQAVPAYGGGFSEHGGGKFRLDHKAVESYAITDDANEWRAEMKIDLKKLGLTPDKYPWLRINFVRNRGAGGFAGCSWFPSPSAHKEQESRGWLVFEPEKNLLKNADFSDWPNDHDRPTNWYCWKNDDIKPEELTKIKDGVRFFNSLQCHQLVQTVPVTEDTYYEFSCLKKVQTGQFSYLVNAVQWKDKNKKALKYSMCLDSGYDMNFAPMRKTFKAPKGAVTAQVIIGPYGGNRKNFTVKGTIEIKNVCFAKTTAPEKVATSKLDRTKDIQENLKRLCPDGDKKFGIGVVGDSEKLYPYTLYKGSLTDSIKLALAGNEYGSFQLAVIPFGESLKDVSVSFSSLKDSEGREISTKNLKWYREDYVKLEKPQSWLKLDYKHEREPDQLLPAAPFNVEKNTLAAVWVDVHMPSDTPKSFYKGTVSVTANGETQTRPIEVESFGFNIPKISSITNEFWWTPVNWMKFYKGKIKYTPELHAKNAETLGRYRISSFPCDWLTLCPQVTIYAEPDGSFSFDWTTFDKYVENARKNGSTAYWSALSCNSGWTRYLHNPKTKIIDRKTGKTVELKNYLPPMKPGWPPLAKLPYKENRVYRDFLKAYVKHLKELGINDQAYYELFDEPGGERFLAMLEHHKFLREIVPELKLLNFNVSPKTNVDGKTAVGLIDTWAPGISKLVDPEVLEAMYKRRAENGEKLWFYTCAESRRSPDGKSISSCSKFTDDNYSPYCHYFRPFAAIRIQPWMAWKYKMDGFYIFMLNCLPKINTETAKRWPEVEWSDGGEKGMGTLIYPGPGFTIIPSIRLATLRKGLEDYEYFALLRRLSEKLDKNKDANLLERINKVLEIEPAIITDVYDWTKEQKRLDEKRRQLATLIQESNDHLK